MTLKILIICLIGLAIDIYFIKTELNGQMLKATILKGIASLFFVLLGILTYSNQTTSFGKLILIGLVLGMLGDILLNMRNLYEGKKSMIVFALGILAFLSGHFLYIGALISKNSSIFLMALIVTLVLFIISVPPLMRRIIAPSKGLKIFGYVYLAVVICMFSCALSLLIKNGLSNLTVLFTIGGFLFMVSDFIMIYYSFGKKIKPLRVINLLSYYFGQLIIAICILFA